MNITIKKKLDGIQFGIEQIVSILRNEPLSNEEIYHYKLRLDILRREYRKLRGEHDVLFFAYTYFSDMHNPVNENNLIPGNYDLETAPPFHMELCGILDQLEKKPNSKICWSVPRGHGKSAYLSNVYPVHQIVYGKRKYIIIISETEGMSQKFVEWVADQLKFNAKLREDFGELLSPNKNANEADNLQGFVTHNNTRVQSASIGKQLRGARHGAYRPDLVILDDLESSKNTNTKELRDKNFHWFNSVVMPIGDITKTAYIYMGTLVHGQGLLPAVLNRSDFQGKIYSAIVSEPVNTELWTKIDTMLRDLDNPNREDDVDQFYLTNKEDMDLGAMTLWNDRFTYLDLMKIKANVGSRAFGSEYLNRPTDDESAIFKSDMFMYYDDKDLYYNDGRPMNLEIYSFFDMALGKNERSDYNAIVTVGRDKRTGVVYILDAWASKCPLHKAVEVAIEKVKYYRPKVFGCETVQTQYEIYRQLRDKLIKMGIYSTRVLAVTPRGKKEDRIESLEPLVEAGAIRFKKNQRLLIEMLEQFGSHDKIVIVVYKPCYCWKAFRATTLQRNLKR